MKRIIAALSLALAAIMPAAAQDFFDTSDADDLFSFGARIGFNTSNRTIGNPISSVWNKNSWGTGFDVGVVADINLKNFISIQPGLFFETRNGTFAYENLGYDENLNIYDIVQLGKGREYLFNVPVIASVHFNVLDNLRWNVDFGPYFQFKLRSTFDHKFEYPVAHPSGLTYFSDVKTGKFDVGFKMGMSLDIFRNYYVGVHYLAGMCHPWNPGSLKGHNKEWLFTIGYNFFRP